VVSMTEVCVGMHAAVVEVVAEVVAEAVGPRQGPWKHIVQHLLTWVGTTITVVGRSSMGVGRSMEGLGRTRPQHSTCLVAVWNLTTTCQAVTPA